jgi:hypothetical protein
VEKHFEECSAELQIARLPRISCHAAQNRAACTPFSKERRMKFANATKPCWLKLLKIGSMARM